MEEGLFCLLTKDLNINCILKECEFKMAQVQFIILINEKHDSQKVMVSPKLLLKLPLIMDF